MSAMIVSHQTISAILQAVFNAGKSHTQAVNPWQYQNDKKAYHYVPFALEESQKQANVLMAENIRSFNHCYAHRPERQAPALTGNVELSIGALPHGPLQALKLVLFVEFQSCECDDWESTEAYHLLNKYKNILIGALPGYDRMAWGL